MIRSPLGLTLAIALAWLAIAVLGLVAPRSLRFVARVLFPLGAALGAALAGVALGAIAAPPHIYVAPLGLPDLPFHFRMDALSAFFLLLLGAVSAGVSVFAAGYMRPGEGTAPGLQCLWYHLFLASMAFVLVADDAYAFMVAWESMALSSFFLVTSDHRQAEIRRAGYLYLLIAHVGAIAILLCFGVLQGGTHDYTFGAMRAVELAPAWATVAFLLALFGFGAKAGILPLHVWLPEAHPAAPSPVSALMSAVMLKTAIYGMLRVTFDLLHTQIWWWGVVALAIGLATALFGVVFSAVQNDMKRLLAYSSIENIGFIVVGFGLTVTFAGYGMRALAALALTATLYHCLNHAYFKSLLFLATGSVLHATRERALGKLGGLIHRMPWVAWLALVGALATAGLPPLNGFVSEWLLLQAFLFTPELPGRLPQHAGAARRGGDRARRRAVGVRDGEVLRRGLPRPAARGEARRGARRRHLGAHRARLARRGLRRARHPAGAGHAADRLRHRAAARDGTRRGGRPRPLAVPRADRSAARELLAAAVRGRPRRR